MNLRDGLFAAIGAAVIALAVAVGGVFTDTPPSPTAPAAPSTSQCPRPPRTGGAVFAPYGTGQVQPDGSPRTVAFLSCDYAGEWNYSLRSDGFEQLQRYKGPGSPVVYSSQGEIDAVLASLR